MLLHYENTNSADHCIDRCSCSPNRRSKRGSKAHSRRPSNGSKNISELEVQEVSNNLDLAIIAPLVTQERPVQPGLKYMQIRYRARQLYLHGTKQRIMYVVRPITCKSLFYRLILRAIRKNAARHNNSQYSLKQVSHRMMSLLRRAWP